MQALLEAVATDPTADIAAGLDRFRTLHGEWPVPTQQIVSQWLQVADNASSGGLAAVQPRARRRALADVLRRDEGETRDGLPLLREGRQRQQQIYSDGRGRTPTYDLTVERLRSDAAAWHPPSSTRVEESAPLRHGALIQELIGLARACLAPPEVDGGNHMFSGPFPARSLA
jgi:hypothetical protein